LQERLMAGLDESSIGAAELLNPPTEGNQARFLAFRSPRAAAWKEQLGKEEVIVDVRSEVLRIGLGLYHDARDVDRLIEHLRELE
jgi:selenocysteine lyase/cysteine desulfurase